MGTEDRPNVSFPWGILELGVLFSPLFLYVFLRLSNG